MRELPPQRGVGRPPALLQHSRGREHKSPLRPLLLVLPDLIARAIIAGFAGHFTSHSDGPRPE